ncbi:MAG: 16S rRNA (cytosine(967)-C(5))-methyltransferase RsmB [Cardiobacteriaceae bacterium]|nr:16S rRNA (cytosine(967)-C(5))-methyltransferase RsmB [Cardiobacteriaceae bacterium]
MSQSQLNARHAAFLTLEAVIVEQQTLSKLIPHYRQRVFDADKALYQALCYGVLREFRALSVLRDQMLSNTLPSQNPANILLNIGIYQLLRMNLGDHGVLNETVKLAHKYSLRYKGLVNAILRRVQREREQWQSALNQQQHANLPTWLRTLYPEHRERIAQTISTPPPLTLRLNHKLNRTDWLHLHPEAHANPIHPQAITLPHGSQLEDYPDFAAGKLSVQDASAQHATIILNPQAGERILDACAAPGGKTGHVLEWADVEMVALDIEEERLERVQQNLSRLQKSAQLICADAIQLKHWYDGKPYDGILLDAPCSGSGVLRRHPDISWLRSKTDLQQYPKVQLSLLLALWQTLKVGGRLLYTTCSILPQENEKVIAAFLTQTPNARERLLQLEHAENRLHGALHLPSEHGDGFYYALLEKTA